METKVITVKELYDVCRKELINGNGNKKILISQDDEGNGYHELFYGFTPVKDVGDWESRYAPSLPYNVDLETINDYIILG